jgi:hypothetical protein
LAYSAISRNHGQGTMMVALVINPVSNESIVATFAV